MSEGHFCFTSFPGEQAFERMGCVVQLEKPNWGPVTSLWCPTWVVAHQQSAFGVGNASGAYPELELRVGSLVGTWLLGRSRSVPHSDVFLRILVDFLSPSFWGAILCLPWVLPSVIIGL